MVSVGKEVFNLPYERNKIFAYLLDQSSVMVRECALFDGRVDAKDVAIVARIIPCCR